MRLFILLLALGFSTTLLAEKVDESANPTGCQDTGHHYTLKTLVLTPGVAGAQQTLFFFYNQRDESVNLFQMHSKESAQTLFLNHTVHPHQWAVLAASEKTMRFICAIPSPKKRYGEVVDCANSIKVCEFTGVRYGMNNRGNFWMVDNSTKNGALNGVVHYGVIP